MKTRPGDQPLPIPNNLPDIQSQVIEDIKQRRQVGIERYGTALQPDNGRDALQDAYEEALDLCMYLKQCIVERDLNDGLDEDKATYALAVSVSPQRHSQQCPVWLGRDKGVSIKSCNCWVMRNARVDAQIVLGEVK